MVVAIIHPQEYFTNKPSRRTILAAPPNMKLPNPNPKFHRSSRTHSNRKNRHSSPAVKPGPPQPKPASHSQSKSQQANNKLVMGQVKILKRGEKRSKTVPDQLTVMESSSALPLTGIVDGLYAGYSMSVVSPPPSSVPLPAFITKKIAAVSDATRELQKVLRL